LGLPILSGARGGVFNLLGPTGGYLLGFMVAAWVVGRLITLKSKTSFLWIVTSMTLGSIIILTLGALWLGIILHVGITKAILLGVLPFIPGDIVKLLAAATIYQGIQKRAREIF
jgi:biotin transport system substrate-specific component